MGRRFGTPTQPRLEGPQNQAPQVSVCPDHFHPDQEGPGPRGRERKEVGGAKVPLDPGEDPRTSSGGVRSPSLHQQLPRDPFPSSREERTGLHWTFSPWHRPCPRSGTADPQPSSGACVPQSPCGLVIVPQALLMTVLTALLMVADSSWRWTGRRFLQTFARFISDLPTVS